MSNRIAVVVVALVVGVAFFAGASAVQDALTADPGPQLSGQVVATNATMHLDRVGRPTAVGEVINGLDEPVDHLTVTVTFVGADGRSTPVKGTTVVPVVAPGDRTPFVVRLSNRSARPTAVRADVTYRTGASSSDDGLVVVEDELTGQSESQATVSGRVENHGRRAVATDVVATFYDANGSVVGVRTESTSPRVLDPGASGGFVVRYRTLGDVPSRAGEVDHYALVPAARPANASTS